MIEPTFPTRSSLAYVQLTFLQRSLSGYTCQDEHEVGCHVVSDADVEQKLARLPDSLKQVITQVHQRAPQALLVLIGYLPALPDSGVGCPAVPLNSQHGQRMLRLYSRLTHIIGGVAQETGTPVVRSSVVGYRHDACATDPYVASYNPGVNPSWTKPHAYHPNQTGMGHIASALDAVVFGAGAR